MVVPVVIRHLLDRTASTRSFFLKAVGSAHKTVMPNYSEFDLLMGGLASRGDRLDWALGRATGGRCVCAYRPAGQLDHAVLPYRLMQ